MPTAPLPIDQPDSEQPTASANLTIQISKVGEISGSARFPGSKSGDLTRLAGQFGTGALITVSPGYTIRAAHVHLSPTLTVVMVTIQVIVIAAVFAISVNASRRHRRH